MYSFDAMETVCYTGEEKGKFAMKVDDVFISWVGPISFGVERRCYESIEFGRRISRSI